MAHPDHLRQYYLQRYRWLVLIRCKYPPNDPLGHFPCHYSSQYWHRYIVHPGHLNWAHSLRSSSFLYWCLLVDQDSTTID